MSAWVAGALVVGAVAGAVASSKSAKKGAKAQTDSAKMGVDEQRSQFEATQKLLAPYVQAGYGALGSGWGGQQQPQQQGVGMYSPEQQSMQGSDSLRGTYSDGTKGYDATLGLKRGDPGYMGIENRLSTQTDIPIGARQKSSFGGGQNTNPQMGLSDYGQLGIQGAQGVNQLASGLGENMGIAQQYAGQGMQNMDILQGYADAGAPALQQQQAIAGTLGPKAQAEAISQIESSPQMQAMMRQGEEGILQNASATGGLRGGNVQGALAQFRPQMLDNMINQKYRQLGGLTSIGGNTAQYLAGTGGNMAQYLTGASGGAAQNLLSSGQTATQNVAQLGQAAAANQASASMNMANQNSNLMGQQGAAQAGNAIAQGNAWGQGLQGLTQAAGYYMGNRPQQVQAPQFQQMRTNQMGMTQPMNMEL